MVKSYSIFVSHSWDHSNDLSSLHNLLQNRGYFSFDSQEVTKNHPINSFNELYIKQKLKEKIRNSNILLALAGIYASHSEWMKWEIETAKELGVPVVGIIPRGQERISKIVFDNSIVDVRWNADSIVQAIRDYAI
ncbi:TPA: TIR domain-containing protein [Pasteurella multocida]|uniref:TIR domain-containing protein n=1 Tax=Pasteurella multocida TaxID=747 RepID=UPI0028DEEEFC|nr:TIR domain-containing protein [Pasteurella multocida]MEB3484555.1 TIR domain-containing protein [Pasteurella multocida]MEB3495011.1 TIR domain-containing protein [Pasteurella multocida]HDR0967240.1 TIR domain-containing protein [Pasteurella multocida]HDR0970147.1 TIR domain-containing protein [Pasteurella multocida]HDR0994491.1 TIR domain-containing protein [Pasteurella multocida]